MIQTTCLVIRGPQKERELQFLHDRFSPKVPAVCRNRLFKGEWWMQIPLIDDSPELNELLNLCEQMELSVRRFHFVYHTKKELAKCEFFQLVPPCPTELDGVDLKHFGNTYKGACPVCGMGGKLCEDVLVDRKYPKKNKMGFIQPELYVSGEVKKIIEENELTGLSFKRRMVDYRGREIPDFYVPDFDTVLPPVSRSTWLIPDVSGPSCGHRVIYLQSDICYERDKLAGAKDFNLTQEYIDNWMMRQIVVSSRTKKILQQNKIFCRYVPVLLI